MRNYSAPGYPVSGLRCGTEICLVGKCVGETSYHRLAVWPFLWQSSQGSTFNAVWSKSSEHPIESCGTISKGPTSTRTPNPKIKPSKGLRT